MFESLRTTAFRNLADAETDVSGKNVFLVGENGQGKTNFLESLYFCSYASSFRGTKDADLARTGDEDFSVCGGFSGGIILVKVEKSHKTIALDGKKIDDRKDLLETAPCVVFCHEDMEFVSGSQERRRWFFDQTQSLYDPVYLDDLRRYRRVLKSRNAVLRNCRLGFVGRDETFGLLNALDGQLVGYGLSLMEKRHKAAESFSAVFSALYGEVSGIEGLGVAYTPSWKHTGALAELAEATEAAREKVLCRLEERREADIAQGYTLSGPHRDRYVFIRQSAGSGDFSETASTGQRRLLALLLRVAQARCFHTMTGKTPVLLLDDVILELDGEKRRRFLSVMPDYEQAFFTFLPEEPYKKYQDSDTMIYTVHGGVIRPGEKNR
ncbi:DNA replication and repair protein RecF [Spirochaetia bacterium]|nr:DNA replication and repair protein RecF [Spirochaetia bacterium]